MKLELQELIIKRKTQLNVIELAIKDCVKKDLDKFETVNRFLISFLADLESLKTITTYTKEDLNQIVEKLLEHPDQITDYTDNENSDWDVESLLNLVIE